jgi:hypothetical protein
LTSEINYGICKRGKCHSLFEANEFCSPTICTLVEDLRFLGEYDGGVPQGCPFLMEHIISGGENECDKDKPMDL